jgi:ABC-type lipoprotein export system ATPase subunit
MSLSAQWLSKRYGDATGYEAVRNVSLEVAPGDFVAIVGRSGSGKSTLMAMLGALTKPTQGRLLLDGQDIWTLSERELAALRARHIGFVFQFPSLLSNLTAVDNVAVPALLGRTMPAEAAYARAYDLLARVGLADRADSYPSSMSGGEQRRVVIARALINSPPLLLADEPTSDLDEDSEIDIIDLIGELQRTEAFGFVLVTHNLALAQRAPRIYEMRQGELVAAHLADVAAEPAQPARRFGGTSIATSPATPRPAAQGAAVHGAPVGLGRNLLPGLQTCLLATAVVLGGVLAADFAIGKHQAEQMRERLARSSSLRHIALNSLRGDVQSVKDLGDGRYELTTYLQNIADAPIYVMAPDLRAYVQVRSTWHELPTTPRDDTASGVRKIEDKLVYRYLFDARVTDFAQLLPPYMHVRFSSTMLVSPTSVPKDDVFERKDNYFVHLKPFDVADEVVAKRIKFAGKPPVWIPMPPH